MKLRLDPTLRIFESAAKTEGRYAMHAVRLRLVNGVPTLEATDGRILAKVSAVVVEGEGDWPTTELGEAREFLLDGAAIRAGWKGGASRPKFLEFDGKVWTLRAKTTCADLVTSVFEIEGDFPQVDAVIPPESADDQRVSFNIAYLVKLAKATGAEVVTLSFPAGIKGGPRGYASPIAVHASADGSKVSGSLGLLASAPVSGENVDGSLGVIMPVTSE